MKIWQKIVLGFGLALVILTALTVITYRGTRRLLASVQLDAHSRRLLASVHLVAHSRHVLETEEALVRHLSEAESSVRGYLLWSDAQSRPAYHLAQQSLLADFDALRELVRDTAQSQRLKAMRPYLSEKRTILEAAIAGHERGTEPKTALLGKGDDQRVTEALRALLTDFETAERASLARRSEWSREIGRSTTFVIAGASVAGVILLGVAAGFILHDVAARRRAEEALAEQHNLLSSVIDAMPEHVFVKDLQGHYVLDNKAHRRFLGIAAASEMEQKSAKDFFPNAIADQFEAGDEELLESRLEILHREEPVIDRNANLIWLSTTKVPLRDIDGKCIGLVGVSSDISIRKAAEERVRQTSEQLRRSNMELQDFASVASHDLQEPLRKIQAFGDRLKMKCGPALGKEGHDYLERMQNAAQRMQILLHDLLTLSRVTSRAKPFEAVNLAEIARDVASDLEVRIEQTGSCLEIGFLPTIEADAAQMRQLFQNLISNAMKFQREGAVPEVIISAKILEVSDQQLIGAAPGDEVCQIMVKDNGIGFDEKYLDRIFTVFQRLHSRSEYEGTGIGLAVCRKILDRHGGNISAKSAEGQGATFIVTLPIKQRIKTHVENAREPHNYFDGG